MTIDIPPEIYKYIENKEVPPYELVEFMFNKIIEISSKLERHTHGGRKKKYHTPEEKAEANRRRAKECYHRKKERQQIAIQPISTITI